MLWELKAGPFEEQRRTENAGPWLRYGQICLSNNLCSAGHLIAPYVRVYKREEKQLEQYAVCGL